MPVMMMPMKESEARPPKMIWKPTPFRIEPKPPSASKRVALNMFLDMEKKLMKAAMMATTKIARQMKKMVETVIGVLSAEVDFIEAAPDIGPATKGWDMDDSTILASVNNDTISGDATPILVILVHMDLHSVFAVVHLLFLGLGL